MVDQQKFSNKLAGARVLIIGGTSGIGYAVAEGCLEHGCIVHVASSSPEKVAAAAKSLLASYPSAKGRVQGHVCALNDRETVESNIVTLLGKVGELDHIVHTAGDAITPPQTPDGRRGNFAATVEDTIQLGMVRFFAAHILVKHAVNVLPKKPTSSITITTAIQSERPMPGLGWISGITAGIGGMARGLALDLAPIRVNAVSVGPVKTPIRDRLPKEQREALVATMVAKTLTGDISEPEDTAEAYLYLMRDRSCTGTVIRTDCGVVLT